MDLNSVYLSGRVASLPELSHETHGTAYFKLNVGVCRLSGAEDTLRVLIPETSAAARGFSVGAPIAVRGEMRSYNNRSGEGSRLVLSVLAREAETLDAVYEHQNSVLLTGALCKEPIYRKTPLGREICDMLLAVSRGRGRSDYLPCIAWGSTARYAANMHTGMKVSIKGRLQSREYVKQTEDGEVTKTAFEISASEVAEPGEGFEAAG